MAATVVLATGVSLSADRVRLRSGKVVEGMFMGGDSKSVRVLLDNGSVSEVPIEEAVTVEFSARKPQTHASTSAAESRVGAKGRHRSGRNSAQCATDTSHRCGRFEGGSDLQSDSR